MIKLPVVSNISERAQEITHIFRWFRGGTVSAFSQVEFGMGRTLTGMRKYPKIFPEIAKFPKSAASRSNTFRQVFSSNEHLSLYKQGAINVCDKFDDLIELRNFLAHGFARVDVESETILIRRFIPIAGNEWNVGQYILKASELESLGEEIVSFANRTVQFLIVVSEEFQLGF